MNIGYIKCMANATFTNKVQHATLSLYITYCFCCNQQMNLCKTLSSKKAKQKKWHQATIINKRRARDQRNEVILNCNKLSAAVTVSVCLCGFER